MELLPSDWIALVSGTASLIVALAALVVASIALYRGNRNTSVATALTLNVAFRDAWDRYLHDDAESQDFNLAELMNLFEIGCAMCHEKSLIGVSRGLIEEYMKAALESLEADTKAAEMIKKLVADAETFSYIRTFKAKRDHAAGKTLKDSK